jgi:predicted Rossmann fold flavoprotein
MQKRVIIIGGGAAGFFAAIKVKETYPEAKVTLVEKSNKLLSKVKVSGGGRCNVTNATFSIAKLAKSYPRGDKFLKKAFNNFATKDTIEWFKERGVELVAEADNRMFPVTNDSITIVDCLLNTARRLGVEILKKTNIKEVKMEGEHFHLFTEEQEFIADKLIVAQGGSNKEDSYQWLKALNHNIELPVPSLFTFNMPSERVKEYPGVVVKNVSTKVLSTKLKSQGDLLITHWGMSGPAILKLSAWGARELCNLNYAFTVSVNWMGDSSEEEVRLLLPLDSSRKILNENPFGFPKRFWSFLLSKVEIEEETHWLSLSKKSKNKLVNIITNDQYEVKGKTTFKEEFVTCGGVSLQDIDVKTMESKKSKGLYFCGEVMDIDGITGGFNFQAAWTTAYIAGALEESVL